MSREDVTHRYRALCRWEGTTAAGYQEYGRAHDLVCPPAHATLQLSSDPSFRGDSSRLNPEQLLVGAASSCQLLSFLAVAARARIDVISYVDDAEGEMPDHGGAMSIERIVLRPHIVVASTTSEARLRHLVEVAHRECYIANSLRAEILVEPTFENARGHAFSDRDSAASCLASLAEMLVTPSREFIASATADVAAPPTIAVDLGCGPGHSTRLLSEVTRAHRTIGLDSSEHFLELARESAPANVDYVLHDLTRSGWPVGDASLSGALPDLAYGRLVMAHLPDPAAVVLAWLEELAPGGRLLLEELEWIRTDERALVHYLDLATELVAARGSAMFAGPLIAALGPSLVGRRLSSEVREWPLSVGPAAEMFSLSMSGWRDDPIVSQLVASRDEIEGLARNLAELAHGEAVGRIEWGIRQVVFERAR